MLGAKTTQEQVSGITKESYENEGGKFLSSYDYKVTSEYKLCKDYASESWYQEETISKTWVSTKCIREDKLVKEDMNKFWALKETVSQIQLSESRFHEEDVSKANEEMAEYWFSSEKNNESHFPNREKIEPRLKSGIELSKKDSRLHNRDKIEPRLPKEDMSCSRRLKKLMSKSKLFKEDLRESFSSN